MERNVKLYEQFINEKKMKKKDLKEVEEYGYDCYIEDGIIVVTGENPWNDDNEYTFNWDGENAWTEQEFGGAYYHEPVTSAEEFSNAIDDTDNWE